jgi:benzaldehyde dehydrogenase (NAD)
MTTQMTPPAWSGAIFTGGRFAPAADGGTAAVLEKATGHPLGDVGLAGPQDVDAAVAAAVAAQPAWAATGYDVRAGVLRRAAALLGERADEIVDLIVRETGSIRGKAEYELGGAVNELQEAAALTSRATAEILPSHSTSRTSVAERLPIGVVGVLTPWNFPLVLGMRVIAPALALGNAVVLKPSPETPITGGLLIAEVLTAAGLPEGLFEVVNGPVAVGERIVEHPDVAMVHFTGSSPVGRTIAARAGQALKKVSLELGGNNALVVLEDADGDQAGRIGAWSSFHYQGQTCITAGRHVVRRERFDDYVADLARRAARIVVGDPTQDGVGLGPMINEVQRDRALAMLRDAVAAGARVVEGGTCDGLFFRPTVVVDVTPDMELWNEEIFAPIAPVMAVDDDLEAVRLVNDSPYGLVNAVVSADESRAAAIARQLRGGMAHVNDATCLDEAHVPFGGVGASGLGGRSGGESNVHEYTELRWFTIQHAPVEYPY